jgi:hypothetical protein
MRTTHRTLIFAALLASLAAPVGAQTATSAINARVLTGLLDARGLDAIAARDPDVPSRFVAALYLAGSQLLVVSGEYPAPVLLEQRAGRGEFREIYMELQGASPPEARLFVHDMGADGLRSACDPGAPFDVVYEHGALRTTFDGNWAGQGLTAAEYARRFASDDERYARMLAALIAALRAQT